jgi:hypothetical protein
MVDLVRYTAARHARFVLRQLLAKRVNFYRPLIPVGLLALLRQDSPGFGRPSSSFSRSQLL